MRLVLLIVAAAIALIAGAIALRWSSNNAPTPPQAVVEQKPELRTTTVDVLVAREEIPLGTVITEDLVDRQPWPEHLVLEGFIINGSQNADIIGKVARTGFLAREPFIANKLANPNDPSFLAATLPEGMRAITLSTDAISGVAGYVFPGDRVDVLFSHNVTEQIKQEQLSGVVGSIDRPAYTEVLVPDVRVLAVNVRDASGKAQITANPVNVTVEVSLEDSQRLRLAEKLGTLSLALRSLRDGDNRNKIMPAQLDVLTSLSVGNEAVGVRIIRGLKDETAQQQPTAMQQVMSAPAADGNGYSTVIGGR